MALFLLFLINSEEIIRLAKCSCFLIHTYFQRFVQKSEQNRLCLILEINTLFFDKPLFFLLNATKPGSTVMSF